MIDFSIVRKKYRVYIPSEMMNQKYTGPVYGFYHEATGVFNITGSMSTNGESVIGEISQAKPENSSDLLCGYWEDGKLLFVYQDEPYEIAEYTLEKNLFFKKYRHIGNRLDDG